ncbi:chorismate mutase [Klebsiella michiganensis]|uniref:chorismate mutase n=1 Tax=Klebsiella michiganensis TaxID=1134687 RepID=UPI002570B19B|nr:chorismate mutase [Klebsiella michiganensis]MDL4454772.1 chorismate mutase [Klebsiella michiganensis]
MSERHSIGSLIGKRLSYAKDVAKYKALYHQAIEDIAQEKVVLKKALADALTLGLDSETVRAFIQAQMDAAKAIQYRYRADWLSVPDKEWQPRALSEIRAQISQLSYAILQTVAERLASGGELTTDEEVRFLTDVQQPHLHQQDTQRLWHALNAVALRRRCAGEK